MRAGKLWVSIGALSAAMLWGACEKQEGTGGSGPQAQVQQAQQQTKEAFERAKQAQEQATSKHQDAQSSQQEVQKAQQELQQKQQEAQQKAQAAQQAQQQAQQEAQQSQQRAQESQQQASQAMQQQHQQEQQRRAQEAQQQASQAQQQPPPGQQQPAQPPPAMGGSGAVATEQQVSGEVTSAQSTMVMIDSEDQGPLTLIVDPNTQVYIDGQQRSVGELQQGSDVRVSYSIDPNNQQKRASRIDAISAHGGAQQQQQQQTPPPAQ